MIEAGEPSTGPFRDRDIGCARPTGVVMVALPEAPRNAERAQREGPRYKGLEQVARPRAVERPEPLSAPALVGKRS
jgi:hypothetical protein